jgi:methylenetetrahydrofolate reductase (NADPH)
MPEPVVPTTATNRANEMTRAVADLIAYGSIEMSAHRPQDAREIAALLPVGTRVYVNHLPRHTLADSLAALKAVRDVGLEPVPHIAVRRIASRDEAKSFLKRAVKEAGVREVLLIGGDELQPLGPYADSIAMLREGVLGECGVHEVGIAGYPEGHPRISHAKLTEALHEKLRIATEQGLGAYVLTQFSFAPGRIVEYCSELARGCPGVSVYIGLAGPTDALALLRYAQRCGVSASLRALRDQGFGAVKLVMHTDPREQLITFAQYCLGHTPCNVVGVHVFSFGGVAATAAWMNQTIAFRGAQSPD